MDDAFMEEFQHLIIPLEEIQSATDNFSENNIIGRGGFGNVYKGVIPRKDQKLVAIKRLNTKFGQGNVEFWREITMLSRYTHENLISLVGFCDEGGEKILVYEYAYHGSLDRHLSSPLLTWTQRIKICLDAARGLSYLHDGNGTQQRVLHRDVKSSNILLDENWAAKVSDMGLSKIGPSHQLLHTANVTNVVGTIGYLDPLYMETGLLSKESDVYSFGVMLFEVLCGKLCYKEYKGQCQVLVRSWKQSYKQNHLSDIIFQDLAQQINPDALETFSQVIFHCLQKSRDKRPTMQYVVENLENALESQDPIQRKEWLIYEEIAKTAVPHLEYRSKRELRKLLSVGVFLNNGLTWFSLDNNGKHYEMISIEERHSHNSRFDYKKAGSLRTRIRAQFLSPLITYTTNLVFKGSYLFEDLIDISSNFNYTLLWGIGDTGFLIPLGNTEYLRPHLARKREDGMMMVELCQFTIDEGETVDLDIEFQLGFPSSWEIVLEGIEFRPLEKAEHKIITHEKVDMPYSFNSDTYWEQILPNDYQEILKWSDAPIQWTTKKELYSELHKGFLMNNGQEWFYLNKNGMRCLMLSATAFLPLGPDVQRVSDKTSRFGEEVVDSFAPNFKIVWGIRAQVLSPETTYATYLVYRLDKYFTNTGLVWAVDRNLRTDDYWNDNDWFFYLDSSKIDPDVGVKTFKYIKSPKLPQERSDGWMEVQIWEFQTGTTTKVIPINLQLKKGGKYTWLTVLGVEFRPKSSGPNLTLD